MCMPTCMYVRVYVSVEGLGDFALLTCPSQVYTPHAPNLPIYRSIDLPIYVCVYACMQICTCKYVRYDGWFVCQ